MIPVADHHVLPIAFSAGRAAFSAMVEVNGRKQVASFTQFGLRIWVGRDWNVDPPTVAGEEVRASIVKVIEEIRVRSFVSPQQAAWLTEAFEGVGSLAVVPPADEEGEVPDWIVELQQDHGLVVPGASGGHWSLTPYGAEIRAVLLRAEPQPATPQP